MKKNRSLFAIIFVVLVFVFLAFGSSPAEVIDGPANVRLSPKGKIILSLKNDVPVHVISTQGDWCLISFPAVFNKDSLSATGKARKGVLVYNEAGAEIGNTVDEIEIKNKYEKNGKYLVIIEGYTHRQNVRPSSDKKSPPSLSTLSLSQGLSGEEYLLKDRPPVDYDAPRPLFYPVVSSAEEILKKHQKDRINNRDESGVMEAEAVMGTDKLKAESVGGEGKMEGKMTIRLSRNGSEIFRVMTGDIIPIEPLRGLWADRKHWYLEVAYTINKGFTTPKGQVIRSWIRGDIIQDGESLNERYNYQESFGFQFMNGNPVYFFKRDDHIGISYRGAEISLGYQDVPHYNCCSDSVLNALVNKNMVSFFAQRDSKWYFVEIGVFQ